MLYHIGLTRMLAGAQMSLPLEKRSRPFALDLLIFLLVSIIAEVPQSIASVVYTMVAMLTDPGYYELIMSETVDVEAITNYALSFMNNLPSLYYVIILASTSFMIVAAILYCKLFEKRKAYTLGFTSRGCLPEYLMGVGIGAVMISLPLVACIATNSVTLTLTPNAGNGRGGSLPRLSYDVAGAQAQDLARDTDQRALLRALPPRQCKL